MAGSVKNRLRGCVIALVLASSPSPAAEFLCQDDVPRSKSDESERTLVDPFWAESLLYLKRYLEALETPTDQCTTSAQATIQTDSSEPKNAQTRCILDYHDMKLMAQQIEAILAEPAKARACFDAQKSYTAVPLFTPSEQVRQLSSTAQWIKRPLLTDFYRQKGGAIGAAGVEVNENFVAIASRAETQSHWASDVSIKGLPTLWSSVGWIPMYAAIPEAGSDRFRGGYLYAEMMGPWGNLRIATIDGVKVSAEIGMTVQLSNTLYPYHFHHPQEVYMTLTRPPCAKQQRHMLMDWDSSQFTHTRQGDGWIVEIDGSNGRSRRWFADQNPGTEWLTYSDRNAIHAFDLTGACNRSSPHTGLVTVWARSTSRDNEQATRFCRTDRDLGDRRMGPPNGKAICELHGWTP